MGYFNNRIVIPTRISMIINRTTLHMIFNIDISTYTYNNYYVAISLPKLIEFPDCWYAVLLGVTALCHRRRAGSAVATGSSSVF